MSKIKSMIPKLRLLELTRAEFAQKTFSSSLHLQTSNLIGADLETGVEFSYRIPPEVCKNSMKGPRLPISSTIAIFDELSTYAFMIKDYSCRSGVSILLSAEQKTDCFSGDEVTIVCKSDKIGKTIGFCSMQMMNADGDVIAKGKHIKFLPMGPLWNLVGHPRCLPTFLQFWRNYGQKLKNTFIGKKLEKLLLGGGRSRGQFTEPMESGVVGATFHSLGLTSCSAFGEGNYDSINNGASSVAYMLSVQPHLCNIIGVMHGGAVAMAAEEVASSSSSLSSASPANTRNTSITTEDMVPTTTIAMQELGATRGGMIRSMELRYLSSVRGDVRVSAVEDNSNLYSRYTEGEFLRGSKSVVQFRCNWSDA